MKVEVKQVELAGVGAELVAVGLLEDAPSAGGRSPPPPAPTTARSGFKKTCPRCARTGFPPVLVVGLGERDELDAEKLRVAAAIVAKEAARLEAGSLAWALPEADDAAAAAGALVTGTILAAYRFDRFKSGEGDESPRASSR